MPCSSVSPWQNERFPRSDRCFKLDQVLLLHVPTATGLSVSMILASLRFLSRDGRSFGMGRRNSNSKNSRTASRPSFLSQSGHCGIDSHSLALITLLETIPMPNKHPLMKLSPDEDLFLRHWMYDEVHYQDRPGPAKRLQLQHRAIPADLATLIAAAIPDPADQEKAGSSLPSTESLIWPWSESGLSRRLVEARTVLAEEHFLE